MPRSHSEMRRRALARIQRLCCMGVGGQMLMPDLIHEMAELIPSQLRVFFWLGSNLEITNVFGTLPPPLKEIYHTQIGLRRPDTEVWVPYAERVTLGAPNRVQRAKAILRVDERAFLRSEYYNLLIDPVDAYEPVLLPIRDAHRIHGMFFVWRAVNEVPFDAMSINMLESMAGFVAHGMTQVAAAAESMADNDDRALLVIDRGGRIRHADAQGQRLLIMALNQRLSPFFRLRSVLEAIPEIARLAGSLVATTTGNISYGPPVLRLRNPWGEFILRAYWLGPTDGTEQTDRIGITIERRVPEALALRRTIERLSLTGREKEFCLLVAGRRSALDIADAMGVAPSTIITHQRNVYDKLGVHSRAGLLAALQTR
jgi:DNA-binding CsgD family transcriptional regulator